MGLCSSACPFIIDRSSIFFIWLFCFAWNFGFTILGDSTDPAFLGILGEVVVLIVGEVAVLIVGEVAVLIYDYVGLF